MARALHRFAPTGKSDRDLLLLKGRLMATADTCNVTVGVLATRTAADQVISELKRAGYRDDQIGLIAKNASGKPVKRDGSGMNETNAGEGIGAADTLVGWGIPEEDAQYYESELSVGRYLLTVEYGQRNARDLLVRHGGYNRATAPKI
jgi:hypothetical protein